MWRQRDYTFDLVLWENFIDAMSKEGLQHEYNRAIQDSDIFVMLFRTKVGPYTLQEFETAFADMNVGTGPRIFTYFRNDSILIGDIDDKIKSLLDFKTRLKELKHYVTKYQSAEDLQYHFSRQLELLYGEGGADSTEINDNTPSLKIGEIALLLTYRHLFGGGADVPRMMKAIERADGRVRNTVFQMASERRRVTWRADKLLMEKTIPVFEALTRTDRGWHAPWGQLGYALIDKTKPDWRRAKECLDRAVDLRGDRLEDGSYYYQYNRARAAIQVDPTFAEGRRADAATRASVLDVLRKARRDFDDIGFTWEQVIKWPDSEPLRHWLELNGSPRLR